MEKIKGFLKRRSVDLRVTANSIGEMEVVSDPENTPENRAVSPNNDNISPLSPSPVPPGEDNTHALMMDKIEQLTNDKYSLEETLSGLQSQLERAQEDSLSLRSKCDDLEKSLTLEKRRFRWQQKFYEKRIQQLTGLPTTPVISSREATPSEHMDMSLDGDDSFAAAAEEDDRGTLRRLRKYQSIEDLVECNSFYEETIKALVMVQEDQAKELNELRKFYEEKLKALSMEHEVEVTEILESGNHQVEKLIRDNEALIRDLLTGCEGLFDQLKVEFTEEARSNVELKVVSGSNIIVQFQGK